jgi:hypothetical protein
MEIRMSTTFVVESERLSSPLVTLAPPAVASRADIALFRERIDLVRRRHRGRQLYYTEKLTALPRAVRQAATGIRRFGAAVQERDGVPASTQFFRLLRAGYAGFSIEDFYLYRLHLDSEIPKLAKTFAFSHVIDMQRHLIDSQNCQDYPRIRNKEMFTRLCAEHALPVVPILAEFVDGNMLAQAPIRPGVDLFSKPADLMLGVGTALWRWQDSGHYADASGSEFELQDIFAALSRKSAARTDGSPSGRIILQERVTNHPAMVGQLTIGGLATIRIVTCRTSSGAIDFLPPVIRMPVGDAIADNIAQGGLAAPIDASGRIAGPAIRKDKRYGVSIFTNHPTTGVKLRGFQLPDWPQVYDLARRAHLTFPALHFIGWDIALTADGPVLVEGNAWWDVDLTVLPHAITLADTQFIPYYNFHFDNGAPSKA